MHVLHYDDEMYINIGSGKNTIQQALRVVPSLKSKILENENDREEKLAQIDQYSQQLNQAARRKSHKDNAVIVITHYQRLLDYIVPDFVHVLIDGKIVKSGTKELAYELEEKGYDWIKEELAK